MPIHPERLRTLALRLSEIANEARPQDGEWGTVRTIVLGSGLVLADECANRFDALCEELLSKEGLSERFSRAFVEHAMDAAISRLRTSEDASSISECVAALERQHSDWNEKYIQHIPIWGATITDPIVIGKVVFMPASADHNQKLVDQIGSIIARMREPESARRKHALIAESAIQQEFLGMICAEVVILGEPERARELAIAEAERSLAILRYCLARVQPPQYRARLGIKGLVCLIDRPVLPSFGEGSEKFALSIPHNQPLDLSSDLTAIESAGLSKLSGISAAANRTQFQQTLLRAIEWVSDSIIQVKTENRLLSLTTCLEALLTPTDRDPISNAVAEGAAILLADKVAARKDLKRRIKYLYGLRSAVSHGGRKELSVADVDELQSIAASLVEKLVQMEDRFESKTQLLEWIEDEKMSPRTVASSELAESATPKTDARPTRRIVRFVGAGVLAE